MNKIELLAPAGDFARLQIALKYGADAVYFGGQNYSLRANAPNFSLTEIKKATKYAHQLHKKVYVTVNIIFHEADIVGLTRYLKQLTVIGVDAVIVTDILVVQLINRLGLKLKIHLSTQANTLNYEAVNFWHDLKVQRIILAREISRHDLIQIKTNTGVELECFGHGAMCTAFSGQCALSNYLTNRDANRGGCAQICRWIFETGIGIPFTMMAQDLNLVAYLHDMITIGITSIKIEGRMRSIYYIATVIGVYRQILDHIYQETLTPGLAKYYLSLLNRCANRDSEAQFYQGLPKFTGQYFQDQTDSNQDFLGLVQDYDAKHKLVKIEQRNYFKVGTEVEFFGPEMETFTLKIHKIYNAAKEPVTIANHPQATYYLECHQTLYPLNFMRLKVFDKKDFL